MAAILEKHCKYIFERKVRLIIYRSCFTIKLLILICSHLGEVQNSGPGEGYLEIFLGRYD